MVILLLNPFKEWNSQQKEENRRECGAEEKGACGRSGHCPQRLRLQFLWSSQEQGRRTGHGNFRTGSCPVRQSGDEEEGRHPGVRAQAEQEDLDD